MKWTAVFSLVAIVAASLAQLAIGMETKDDKSEAELRKLDLRLTEALVKREIALLERHTGDDFILTNPIGVLSGKREAIEAVKSGTLAFESIKDSEVKVHVYGDTGVLTGRSDIKGKDNGRDISGPYRWTRVYTNRAGRWQCVAEQITRIARS
jgi:ketosteroid isomerase-like protein